MNVEPHVTGVYILSFALLSLLLIACAEEASPSSGDALAVGDTTTDSASATDAGSADGAPTSGDTLDESADLGGSDTADGMTADGMADGDVSAPGPTPICVAIRGNGELITAHFAALARLAELFGPFEGVAGGSSGSITAFLTESLHMHPGLSSCGGVDCSRAEAGARLGLLYKSLFGYLAAMGERDEAVAATAILGVIEYAKSEGIGGLIHDGKIDEAWTALLQILESDDVRDLVNPEMISLLRQSPNRAVHLRDVWESMTSMGGFKADDPVIFLRPGIINFAGLAAKLGRIGSFYAGYGDYDAAGWEAFFEGCAEAGLGKPWEEVKAIELDGNSTCGARFHALVSAWRAAFIPVEGTAHNRVDDRVGEHLRTLVITSVLTNQAENSFDTARDNYVLAQPWELNVSYGDVRVGYWGRAVDAAPAANDALGFGDLKSSKGIILGQPTWREALSLSPAEPGLSRGVDISTGYVSVGGWPDLHPVMALRNAGCERVVYLTRRGDAAAFGQDVARLLGMSEAQRAAIYDLANPDSSFTRSLSEAAGVWCTDWDSFSFSDLSGIIADAYSAPFEIHDPTLAPVGGSYPGSAAAVNLPGCTPGVLPTVPQ